MRATIRYAVLDPKRIFNLTSPRYLPEISRKWTGKKDWHDARYEPLRDLIENEYVSQFDAVAGHYRRLHDSIEREGFRNPIMVSAGFLERRLPKDLPPDMRGRSDLIVSEYLGGSRLWVAARLGVPVPCIVNDYANVLPDAETLPNLSAVLEKFTDAPKRAEITPQGAAYINSLPFMHLPASDRYTLEEQILIRRGIIESIMVKVRHWLRMYDVD